MPSQDLATKVSASIIEWARCNGKLVIAIDGYTGIGKTTLLSGLAALNPDILSV